MDRSLKITTYKNFLLTIPQVHWLEQEKKKQKISESAIIRNLIDVARGEK
jgi:hypothetical protein